MKRMIVSAMTAVVFMLASSGVMAQTEKKECPKAKTECTCTKECKEACKKGDKKDCKCECKKECTKDKATCCDKKTKCDKKK